MARGIAMLPNKENPMTQFHKQLVSKKELKTVCGIPYSAQHIARLEHVGQFPKRIRLGINRVAWLLSEIEAWVDERLANRDIPEEKINSF
jgi:prophage regulatory protein